MKVERSERERTESRIVAFPGVTNPSAAATAFTAALRHHQQRQTTHREEPGRTGDSSSARSTGSRASAFRQPNGTGDEDSCPFDSDEAPELALDSPRMLSMLFMRSGGGVQEYAAAAVQREARRRRSRDDDNESPCIEITHSPTGTRCLLSRQDGVWVLSLQAQSAMTPANARALLETLRSQFTERGLGPIDIVL